LSQGPSPCFWVSPCTEGWLSPIGKVLRFLHLSILHLVSLLRWWVAAGQDLISDRLSPIRIHFPSQKIFLLKNKSKAFKTNCQNIFSYLSNLLDTSPAHRIYHINAFVDPSPTSSKVSEAILETPIDLEKLINSFSQNRIQFAEMSLLNQESCILLVPFSPSGCQVFSA
jgi:hypothetical protein